MLQLVLVVVLGVLWMATVTDVGGTDFMRVTVFKYGFNVIRVTDLMIGMVLICFIIAARGPMLFTGLVLLVLWAMNLFGVPQLFGIEITPIVAIVLVVGM